MVDLADAGAVQSIPLGEDLTALAVDETRGHLFLIDRGSEDSDGNAVRTGQIYMLDVATLELVRAVPVGREPRAIALDATAGVVFVANGEDNTVSVLDATSSEPLADTAVGFEPIALAVAPQCGRAFVANYSAGTISVLESSTGRIMRTVKVGDCPQSFAVDDDRRRVFVASSYGHSIAVIDADNGDIVATVPTDQNPNWLALDVHTHRLFVAHNVSGSRRNHVSVIDINTLQEERSELWGQPLLGDFPIGAFVDEMTGCVFVISAGDRMVTVLDADALTDAPLLVRRVSLPQVPRALALSRRAGKCLVVGNSLDHESGTLSILDAGYP
jgi:DNA-binding beta-propeller fold protein YncE